MHIYAHMHTYAHMHARVCTPPHLVRSHTQGFILVLTTETLVDVLRRLGHDGTVRMDGTEGANISYHMLA